MAYKQYKGDRMASPFAQTHLIHRSPIGPAGHMHDERWRNMEARKRDEENKEELLDKAKGRMLKKAERKERKAAKRTEQGRDRSAARKTRKAAKIRKAASELTADEVISRRDMMRR